MGRDERSNWGIAYATQADADFSAWTFLDERAVDLPSCQKLNFLQMACEKIGKAYLCLGGADPDTLQSSHAHVAKQLPTIFRILLSRQNVSRRSAEHVMRHVKHLAREIELLAPSVRDNGKRPDNCEYPWEDSAGSLHVPSESHFEALRLLMVPSGRVFLKLLKMAIDEIITKP